MTPEKDYVSATLVLSNISDRLISYNARFDASAVDYLSMFQTPAGCNESDGGCGLSLSRFILKPSESVTFTAALLPMDACKVGVEYEDSRRPSHLWSLLPGWMTARMPWCRDGNRIVTGVLNLKEVRDAAGMSCGK